MSKQHKEQTKTGTAGERGTEAGTGTAADAEHGLDN